MGKVYNHKETEEKVYKTWEEKGYFRAQKPFRKQRQVFDYSSSSECERAAALWSRDVCHRAVS